MVGKVHGDIFRITNCLPGVHLWLTNPQELTMKPFRCIAVLLAGVFLVLPGSGRASSRPGNISGVKPGDQETQARNENAAERAAVALNGLGVPLVRDPSGQVRWIEAIHGEMTDEALRHLAALPLLEWLEIGGGKATPAGLGSLKDCRALRRLYVHDFSLGKDPLTWLADLPLEALSLQRTGISGGAIMALKAAGSLTVLNLSENPVTDEGLAVVARFTNLEVLALQSTKVTGAGLSHLKGMAKLNVLNLENCGIADADLSQFLSMPNLRIVHAAGCNLSDEAVKNITATLSMLAIFR
jgi:hypothetical protein